MESETVKRLLSRLRKLREDRELTQEAFAELAGLQYKHYQAVEAGRKRDFRISTLEKMAKALGLEPWQLLFPDSLTPTVAEAQAKYIHRRSRRPKKKE